jgi:hypothetical protein|tara:strand:- start:61 stop:240 length:180 start_codon:yes stop_codon:yes gene_type:complete
VRREKITKENKKQIRILNRASERAIRKVERERRGKRRNYIEEWFRYIELVNRGLKKYLN